MQRNFGRWIVPAAVFFVLVFCYAGAFAAPWHFDDGEYICQNPGIRTFEGLKGIELSGRRYLLWLSNYFCYATSATFGNHAIENPDVRVFRLWNLGCHFLSCLALYGLLKRVLARRDELSSAPLIASLLFAAHPLVIESVTYISGRANSQGGMFYLAGLYFAAVALDRLALAKGWIWPALLCWGCGIASIATKESHITFPIAVVLLYGTFYRIGAEREARRVRSSRAFLILTLLPLLLMVLAVPYIYERVLRTLSGAEGASPMRALATQAYAVPWMLAKALFPISMNIDPDFPTFTSLFQWQAAMGAMILALVLAFGIRSVIKGSCVGFAALLALLSVLPTNSLIERGDVASERNFYIAAACGAVAIACALDRLFPRRRAAGFAAVMLFSVLCVGRNWEFRDTYTLWRVTAERSPRKLRPWLNHALTALERERFDESEAAFKHVIELGREKLPVLRPDEVVERQSLYLAFADLAAVKLQRLSKTTLAPEQHKAALEEVEKLYREGLTVSADDPDLALSFAQFLLQTARPQHAAEVLRASLARYPNAQWLWGTLGRAEAESGDFENGVRHLESALSAVTRHPLGQKIQASPEERREALYYLTLAEIAQGDAQRIRARLESVAGDSELFKAIIGTVRERLDKLSPAALSALALALRALPQEQLEPLHADVRAEIARRAPGPPKQ